MIEIKFILDPELNVYDQLLNHVSAFAPTSWPLHAQEDEAPVTRVTPDTPVETEPTEPKKRGRKPKETAVAAKEEVVSIAVPVIDEQDVADEAAEAASDVLTHDDVRAAVGEYTKRFGIVAAQKNVPAMLGCPIAEIPDTQEALSGAIAKLKNLMNALEEMTGTTHGIHNTPLFDEEPETTLAEITEANVREALMAYAAKYDVDDKMANTLVDGPDILKKTFGPTVSALRLVPKDATSLRRAYEAIHDAIKNNWYNRKVLG